MALQGPILLIEDDSNDADVIATAIREIGIPNVVKILDNAQEALDYLYSTTDQPYLILCDIRMPGMDGLAFRKSIIGDPYLKKKSIPFIYYSALASQEIINSAFDLDVQGFFKKTEEFGRIKEQLLSIFMYWKQCFHPNKKVEGKK